MNARKRRGVLSISNIVQVCQENNFLVIEQIQEIIDAPDLDLPDIAASNSNVILLQALQSYYSNQYPYLIGLWGVLRAEAGTDKNLIAMRDYLEKAASACKVKYEGGSRMLTGFQTIREEKGMRPI